MSKSNGFLKIALEALELYNRYHSPEAEARIVEFNEGEGKLVVEFSGTFCMTCGIRDWVEDFKYVLKGMGCEAELVEYLEPDNDLKRIGIFRVDFSRCS